MIQAQLGDLELLHRHLEEEIADAVAHCSVDDLTITGLKRRKLRIKDKIEFLRHHSKAALH